MIEFGRPFYKMSGSGNDFVFFDARTEPAGQLATPDLIGQLCARGLGIGADGVVFLENSTVADVGLRYFNRDGTLADLCGNASLCTTRLATELGAVNPAGFRLETGSGVLNARIRNGLPEIDLAPVRDVATSVPSVPLIARESHLGFALAGVPHVVIGCQAVDEADVAGRGEALRHDRAFRDGANVNFVQKAANGSWRYRTYERGVEAETLACGTGAVATAVLLKEWGLAGDSVDLITSSGRTLQVTLKRSGNAWTPSLRGEGRLVFSGRLGESG
ncbi:MAG: diaminopimelate epimerase [Gemmatimonadaceae bacterium]|nr:diaminopimelate epimerase [Gemmatimonadaceae bacterium]